jgi:uncharacterized membrane protein YeaQ/YmgE (transglycosylase-associated protein family)
MFSLEILHWVIFGLLLALLQLALFSQAHHRWLRVVAGVSGAIIGAVVVLATRAPELSGPGPRLVGAGFAALLTLVLVELLDPPAHARAG